MKRTVQNWIDYYFGGKPLKAIKEEEERVVYNFRGWTRYFFKNYANNPYHLERIHLCSDRENEAKPTEDLVLQGSQIGAHLIPWDRLTYDHFDKWDKETEKKEIERWRPLLYEEVDDFNTAWVKKELEGE